MPAKRTSWPEARELFAAIYSPPQRSLGTWRRMRRALAILESLEPDGPGRVDVRTIARFAARCSGDGLRSTSVNSLLRAARTACRKMRALGIVKVNPFDVGSFFLRVAEPPLERHLSAADVARILRQADAEASAPAIPPGRWKAARLRALVYLLAYTGLRAGEALYLRPADVELGEGLEAVFVRGDHHRTKTAASVGAVPLPGPAAAVLRDWLGADADGPGPDWVFPQLRDRSRPWTNGGAGYKPADMVGKLARRAGVRGANLLAFRHSFATAARSSFGLSADQVALILRHTSIETQRHYVHRDREQLRRLVAGVDFSKAG